jgi:phosphoenolpyruvate carboxylase
MQPDLKFIRRDPALLFGLVAAMLFCAFSASAQLSEVPEVGVESH